MGFRLNGVPWNVRQGKYLEVKIKDSIASPFWATVKNAASQG